MERIKMNKAGVGFSQNKVARSAGYEACSQALGNLGNNYPDFIILFTASEYDQAELLEGITDAAPDIPLSGCSGNGIAAGQAVSKNGVAVLAIQSESLSFSNGILNNISAAAFEKGAEIFDYLPADKDHDRILLIMPDSQTCDISKLLEGVNESIGGGYKCAGVATGDPFTYVESSQFFDNRDFHDSLSYVLIESSELIGLGSSSGWVPFGDPNKITRSRGNIIYEIEGIPALSFYENKLNVSGKINENNFFEMSENNPFGFTDSEGQYIIRDLHSCSVTDKSIECFSKIPENSFLTIMKENNNSFAVSAKVAAETALNQIYDEEPVFVIVFGTISRTANMINKTSEEINAIRDVVGSNLPLVGIFTQGEIVSGDRGVSVFQNRTLIVAVVTG